MSSPSCLGSKKIKIPRIDQANKEPSHPADKLPQQGEYPYVPPKQAGNPTVVPNPDGPGYKDKKGDVWQWDERHGGHWDVQHKRRRGYTKVSPDGLIIGGG
jgi:hypothetical protein